jgi:hypothetical protein
MVVRFFNLPLILLHSKFPQFGCQSIDLLSIIFELAGLHLGGCAHKKTQGDQHEEDGIDPPENIPVVEKTIHKGGYTQGK